jgi:hypothetical protein
MVVALQAGSVLADHPSHSVGFAGTEKKVDQFPLRPIDQIRNPGSPATEEGFWMGYGGALTLVNGSPFNWVTSSTPSYQMDAWSWPTVNAGTTFS